MQAATQSMIPGAIGQASFPANMPVPPGAPPPGFGQMSSLPVPPGFPPGMPVPPFGFAPPLGTHFLITKET